MTLDPLSPVAPARAKALLLPLGKIRADRFASFVERLRAEHVIHLRDISASARPNRNMFSPLAFPDGAIVYDLVTHLPPPSHLALSPFDLYREPLAVVALADAAELQDAAFSRRRPTTGSAAAASVLERNIRALDQELEELRDSYPKALVHQVLVFDYAPPADARIPMPDGVVPVPPPEGCKRTTMKTIVCDISSLLLAEMTTLARSFEAMTSIESPGHYTVARQINGGAAWSAGDGASNGAGRRNSQFALPHHLTRSTSATGADRHHPRMSMPPMAARPGMSSSNSTPARPSTPVKGGALPSIAMSPDDGHGAPVSGPSSPEQRPARPDGERAADRVSVHGFGPGGASDRWRQRGKGRASVVIGSMYLQAGRWADSLRELSEGAAAARSLNDHVWHGKALELIVVNLILLAWSDLEFQVPAVCQPPQERPGSSSGARPETGAGDASRPKHLRHLETLLPELLDRIMGLYSRISTESLPPLPMSETIIRFGKMLSAMYLCGGQLTRRALDMMVAGAPPDKDPGAPPPRPASATPTRHQIVSLLFRAFPSATTELLTTADRVSILCGIASVLGPLGYWRKKAMVIRELVSVLIGGLVEARTRGAAEAGVHPAAGLLSLPPGREGGGGGGALALDLGEADVEQGIDAFLELLCRSYGIVGYGASTAGGPADDSDEAAVTRILRQSSTRLFGFTSIKLNILRACINFSEALPDFGGVLKFSSDLMRTAGSGLAPGPKREDAAAAIDRDEQVRLATNMSRTAGLARRIGMGGLAAEYWDEFLVRNIALEPLPDARTPIPHARSVLPGASATRASQDVDPFIYNPFLKEPAEVAAQTLVAGETASFKVTLQNTFDVEVEIESIRLCTEGAGFDAVAEAAVVGPYRTQLLRLRGRPTAAGPIQITGAVVKVRGCRERRFPILTKPWAPSRPDKIKSRGLAALGGADGAGGRGAPEPRTLSLEVIGEQPLVVIKSTTLAQSAVMMLEGERRRFSVTMRNTSSTPVDFILFSFKDSTQAPLQEALDKRDATPAELHEYELILTRRQALRLPRSDQSRHIAAGGEATFEFEILGKPGLTSATIQADYTHLGVPRDEVTEQFHTRQLSLDLTVTVNASVELSRVDALPLAGPMPRALWERMGGGAAAARAGDYCLLSLDLRNAWPSHMAVRLEGEGGLAVEEHILPGKTSRVTMPVRRVYLEDAHEAIPSLNPSRTRQFVVSASKISPDAERASREAFWFRERILDGLRATWRTTSAPVRSGAVELRNMRLGPRMVEAIKVDEVDICVWVEDEDAAAAAAAAAAAGEGAGEAVAYVDEFLRLRVRLMNRSSRPMYPLVRLLPALRHRPLNVALDHTRKFAWNGTLQQQLPLLAGHGSAELTIGATPLCRGEFELTASVEEVQVWEQEQEQEQEREQGHGQGHGQGQGPEQGQGHEGGGGGAAGRQGRARSDTQKTLDAALGGRQRRMWHSRTPCLLTVRDRP